jgi:hypothetical protein
MFRSTLRSGALTFGYVLASALSSTAGAQLLNHKDLSASTPPIPKAPDRPIFIAEKVSLAVSREKDGKLRLIHAGWDNTKVLLLGTALMAEADSGPFMTSDPAPMGHLWRSHCPLGSPNSQSCGRS